MFEFHVIAGPVVKDVLDASVGMLVERVEQAYLSHYDGQTVNPDSYFLRFPKEPDNRIIALPAAIDGASPVAGIKWISSFPGNIRQGIPRASAVIVLNDRATGYPIACMEGAQISALRTAASAVLGAYWLNGKRRHAATIGFVGAGVIARNIARMFRADRWQFDHAIVHDFDDQSASALQAHLGQLDIPDVRCGALAPALEADIVVFATTAATPYVVPPMGFKPGQVILNISLRDIAPELILEAENICDDVDHCLKANTSPHLAEQRSGNRSFINGTLAGVIRGDVVLDRNKPMIFSPFGLGVLDLDLAQFVLGRALATRRTLTIDSFFAEERRW